MINSNVTLETKYLKLIDCNSELPPSFSATASFVPGLGFTQSIFTNGHWQSTITHQEIFPTHWLKPIDLQSELNEINIQKNE